MNGGGRSLPPVSSDLTSAGAPVQRPECAEQEEAAQLAAALVDRAGTTVKPAIRELLEVQRTCRKVVGPVHPTRMTRTGPNRVKCGHRLYFSSFDPSS